ncbi:hypothetical protein VNO77_34189 [Canavalia gladiata]|uniref:Uncharacterized protein n=1 Tax=Canavalia gladiata TaxID=3824 RepID=A0AAN9KFR9_CANGL
MPARLGHLDFILLVSFDQHMHMKPMFTSSGVYHFHHPRANIQICLNGRAPSDRVEPVFAYPDQRMQALCIPSFDQSSLWFPQKGILPSLEAPLCTNLAKLWAHDALRLVTTIECPWSRTSSDWSIGPLKCRPDIVSAPRIYGRFLE